MVPLALGAAIAAGLAGTLLTRASRGFRRWLPALGAIGAYGVATVLMAWLVQQLPVGVVYAIWTGAAAVALVVIDRVAYGERTTALQVGGMAVTLLGIVLLAAGSR